MADLRPRGRACAARGIRRSQQPDARVLPHRRAGRGQNDALGGGDRVGRSARPPRAVRAGERRRDTARVHRPDRPVRRRHRERLRQPCRLLSDVRSRWLCSGPSRRTTLPEAAVAVGFTNVVRALADRGPLLLAIDDVQWLDAASAEALAFAIPRLTDHPVLFLFAKRSRRLVLPRARTRAEGLAAPRGRPAQLRRHPAVARRASGTQPAPARASPRRERDARERPVRPRARSRPRCARNARDRRGRADARDRRRGARDARRGPATGGPQPPPRGCAERRSPCLPARRDRRDARRPRRGGRPRRGDRRRRPAAPGPPALRRRREEPCAHRRATRHAPRAGAGGGRRRITGGAPRARRHAARRGSQRLCRRRPASAAAAGRVTTRSCSPSMRCG